MDYGKHALDAKLKLQVDDEHRVVVINTPDGLDSMTDAEILALVRRVSDLRTQYRAAGYAVTRWGAEHPKWRPEA
jgi:hypothetical protein